MKNNKTTTIVFTLALGGVYWIVGELIYHHFLEKWYTPALIAFYFGIFSLFLIVGLSWKTMFSADFSDQRNQENRKQSHRIGLIALCIALVFSFVFEILYELGKEQIPDPTSYIFLIDDSGSMKGNENDRIQAIGSIMENSNLPYTVYRFNSSTEMVKEMGVYKSGDEQSLVFHSDGGTDIQHSIETAIQDYKDQKLLNAGDSPKIILVSDGKSRSSHIRSVCDLCRQNQVVISTVGMEGSDTGMLKGLAGKTGGVYVSCENAAELGVTMNHALRSKMTRNLISERIVYQRNTLYGFLRVLFLIIVGLFWSLFKVHFLWCESDVFQKSLIMSFAFCCAGAILLELLSSSSLSLRIVHLIFVLCWAATYCEEPIEEGRKRNRGSLNPYSQISGDSSEQLQNTIDHGINDDSGEFQIDKGDVFSSGNEPFTTPHKGISNNPFHSSGDNLFTQKEENPFENSNGKPVDGGMTFWGDSPTTGFDEDNPFSNK